MSWAAPCCCEPLLPVLHRAVHCRAFAGCFLGQHCCFWTSSPGTEWGWLSEALLNLVVMISLFFHRCTFSVTKPSACIYYYCKLTDKASQLEQNIKLIASCSKCFEENAAHKMFLLLVPFSSCQHLGALEDVFFPGLQSFPVLLWSPQTNQCCVFLPPLLALPGVRAGQVVWGPFWGADVSPDGAHLTHDGTSVSKYSLC